MTKADIIPLPTPRPAIDPAAAHRFLIELDPRASKFHFTLLPDGPAHRNTRGLFWTGAASWSAISAMCCNRNAAGASVCVAVNETRGAGRKSADVTRIRAVFADWDHGIPENLPLEPSDIHQTSEPQGVAHAQGLWRIDLADTMDCATFAGIEARLAANYGADAQAVDLARILRLPGFLHQKDPKHPFLVRRIGGSGRRYRIAELVAAFPPISPRPQATAPIAVLDARGADRIRRYGIAAINRVAAHLASLQDGRRSAVFTAACSLGKFVAHGAISQAQLESALLTAWQASGAAKLYGRSYALGAIHRGLERSANDPLPALVSHVRFDQEACHADR